MEKTATQGRPAVNITRHYSATPAKVWAAWTDPKALIQWFGPGQGSVVSTVELDVRVGGRYHIRFGVPGGEVNDISGVYQEVELHRKLVFSWSWKSTPDRVSLVTVRIAPSGTGTELVFLHDRFFDQAARDAHDAGWTAGFAKFDSWIEGAA